MRVVVDANVVFSAFLRAGVTRELLLHAPLQCYAPEWLRDEVDRRLERLRERVGIPSGTADHLMSTFWARIQFVPTGALTGFAAEANKRCKRSGSKDAPYVACALAMDATLWTHDRRLASEAGVLVVHTGALAERFLPRKPR